jgi:hypothetical protein
MRIEMAGMRTATEKAALKRRMLNACITKQQSLIEGFKKRIDVLLVTEGYELSHNSEMMDEARSLADALQFAEDEMKQLWFLQLFPDKVITRVEQGAVVATDSATFYISVSIEQFKINGETYIGLSVHSPLYLAMKGKVIGERFLFGGREYNITDLF